MKNFWQILVFMITIGSCLICLYAHKSTSVLISSLIFESSKLELIAPNVVKNGEDFRINCSVVLTDEEKQNAEVILKKDNNEFYRYNKRSKYSNDSIKFQNKFVYNSELL